MRIEVRQLFWVLLFNETGAISACGPEPAFPVETVHPHYTFNYTISPRQNQIWVGLFQPKIERVHCCECTRLETNINWANLSTI